MNVGVIGAGYWGKKHAEEYSNLKCKVFVADLLKSNLDFCKLNYGANPVSDYKAILENDSIDAVSVCTPNETHFSICRDALEAGKNVLLEKPMTTSYEDARKLLELARRNGKLICVGHIFRFNNALRKVKELLKDGYFGKIYNVQLVWTNLEPVWKDRDILLDLAVHPLDIILFLFEKSPKKVFCNGMGFRQENNEIATINYNLGDIFVDIEMSWIKPVKERSLILVGSEKMAYVDCLRQKLTVVDNSNKLTTEIPIVPNNTLKDELKYFLDCIANKTEPEPNGVIGMEIVRLIELSRSSLIEKKEIDIS